MKHKLDEKQITWGITAFLVIAATILLYFAIKELPSVRAFLSNVVGILMPFIYGLVIAYLLCPLYNLCVRKLLILFRGKNGEAEEIDKKREKKLRKIAKLISTIAVILAFLAIVTGFIRMVIPGLIDSLVSVTKMIPDGLKSLEKFANSNVDRMPFVKKYLALWLDNLGGNVTEIIENKIVPRYADIAKGLSAGLSGVMGFVKNFFIGLIICIYFLNSKEIFAAQSKKLIQAVIKPRRAKSFLAAAKYTNRTFGGFITGKLLDSLIIGVLCFIVMTLLGWHYALLISCIVGVTNIIPFFGPFIGAVPSALLLLIVDPMECIYFIIFVVILQQLDGNIIGPKILGDSTGLSSFWVMFAILVGGGLFGFVGMILGIPVFAVIYHYITVGVNSKLKKKGYSTKLGDYKVDVYTEEEDRRLKEKKKKAKKDESGSKEKETDEGDEGE